MGDLPLRQAHATALGRTGLNVSALCLGAMTFGEQNTEAGHQQHPCP